MSQAFDQFDKDDIGFGEDFRSGKGYFTRIGLEGAFRRLKDPSYGSVASNLSAADIEAFKKVLTDKLRSKYRYSKGLNWRDRQDLMHILESWVEAGKITRPDLEDFEKIIDKLSD